MTTPAVTTSAVARPSSRPPTRSVSRAGRIVASSPAQIAVSPSLYADRLSSWLQGRGAVGRPVERAPSASTGTIPRSSSLTASTGGAHGRTPVSIDRVEIAVPADSLVVLIGPAGSGKSTFATRNFAPSAGLSSDGFRDLLRGDPSDQSATVAAFRLLHAAAEERLRRGALTVIDATNVELDAREPLLELANRFERPSLAIVFGLSLAECLEWNARRPDRSVPARVIRRQHALFLRAIPHLESEGFALVRLGGPAAVAGGSVTLLRAESAPD